LLLLLLPLLMLRVGLAMMGKPFLLLTQRLLLLLLAQLLLLLL
jgi:hypothetical protein